MSDHVALALDGTRAKRGELVGLGGQALHDRIADMHAAREAVALHAASHIDSVAQEAVPGALHANHASICRSTMHPCATMPCLFLFCFWCGGGGGGGGGGGAASVFETCNGPDTRIVGPGLLGTGNLIPNSTGYAGVKALAKKGCKGMQGEWHIEAATASS